MSEILKNVLTEALNDEYKSRASYRAVIDKFGEIRPFINIVAAEGRHIEALLPLFSKYGLSVPIDDWEARVEAPQSIAEACRMGAEDEIENAEMYARLLNLVEDYPDVYGVLLQLQRASAENHLPAFQRCVARGSAKTNRNDSMNDRAKKYAKGQGHKEGQGRRARCGHNA